MQLGGLQIEKGRPVGRPCLDSGAQVAAAYARLESQVVMQSRDRPKGHPAWLMGSLFVAWRRRISTRGCRFGIRTC